MTNELRLLVLESDDSMRYALSRLSLGSHVTLQFAEPDEWEDMDGSFVGILAEDSVLDGPADEHALIRIKQKFDAPVIILTTSGHPRFKNFAESSGAAAVLFKPFNSADLRRAVGAMLGSAAGDGKDGIETAVQPMQTHYSPVELGGGIAPDEVFDGLFVELEKRQPLEDGLDAFDVVERHLVKRALEACNGNQSRAARFLGITRNTLRKRIHKYGFSGLLNHDEKS